MGTDFKSVF